MYQEIVSMPLVLEGIIMPTNKENTTGRNFARNSNPDYKKIRRDVFTLVEQLTESNWKLKNLNLIMMSLKRLNIISVYWRNV